MKHQLKSIPSLRDNLIKRILDTKSSDNEVEIVYDLKPGFYHEDGLDAFSVAEVRVKQVQTAVSRNSSLTLSSSKVLPNESHSVDLSVEKSTNTTKTSYVSLYKNRHRSMILDV